MPGKAAKTIISERQQEILRTFCVPAEAQFVAEPDRGDLRCDHAEGDPAWLVHLGRGFAHEVVEFHRVFQSRVRQAVPLDLHGSSADEGRGVKLGKRVSQGMSFASSIFNYEKSV